MRRPADTSALTLLRRVALDLPDGPALSRDGTSWVLRSELLDSVTDVPAAAASGGTGIRVIPPEDPYEAVRALLAAVRFDEVVVVAPQDGPAMMLPAVAAATAGGRIGAGQLVVATSGTTGRPRGLVRSWSSWIDSYPAFTQLLAPRPDDVLWLPGPVTSTLTLFGLCHAVLTGVPVVASGGWWPGRPVPAAATVLHGLPAVLAALLDDDALAPRLRRAVLAGSAGAGRLRARAAARGVAVVEYYGAAELSFVGVDVDGSGFEPFPQVEVELREQQVWVRSPYLAQSGLSFGDPGGLAGDGLTSLQGPDEHGWVSVGDRALATADGERFVLRGRPGTAVVGGHTVLLADVEALLADLAGVLDVAVTCVPDAVLGQQVVAVLAVGGELDPTVRGRLRRQVRAVVRSGLPHARALRLRLVPALPRTTSGKVDRVALAELSAGSTSGDLP